MKHNYWLTAVIIFNVFILTQAWVHDGIGMLIAFAVAVTIPSMFAFQAGRVSEEKS